MFPTQVKSGTSNTLNWGAYTPTTSLASPFKSPLTTIAAPKAPAPAPAATQPAPTFSIPKTTAPAASVINPAIQTSTQPTLSSNPYSTFGVQQSSTSTGGAPLPSPVPQVAQPAPLASANLGGQSSFPAQTQSPAQQPGALSGGLDANGNPIPVFDQNGKPLASGGSQSAPPQYSPTSLIGQTPNFGNYVQGAASAAAGAIPIGQNAGAITQKYSGLIQPMLGEQVGQRTTGTYPVGEGNAAAIGQEIQGLAAQEGQELSGNAQGLTAQQQAAAGLNNAAGTISPQLAPTGQQSYYNPLTQSQSGSNTPFTGGQVQGDVALGQQYAQNVSANNQAKAIKTSIQTYLAANPTLNPSAFTDVNAALQFLNGKVSNPQYQTLSNYLQEYINTLAPILGVGGDTTNLKTQIANGFANAAAQGQSISQVLDGIEQLAQAKLNAQQGGSGSTGGATGAQSSGTGLYSW